MYLTCNRSNLYALCVHLGDETEMSLSILPPELLRLILNGSNAWAAIELWKAGDRTLSAKLVNYGVTDVELVDNRSDSTSRWPTCLTCFKLERLSITRLDGPFYPPDALRQQLEHLYRGLKTLQLYIPNIEAVVLGPSVCQPIRVTTVLAASTPTVSGESDPNPSSQHYQLVWDLGMTWSLEHLERLELGSSQERGVGRQKDAYHYGLGMIARLPHSLTWLGLPRCLLLQPKGLPPNLQTLHLYCNSVTSAHLSYLPKSITDLMHSVADLGLCELLCDPKILPNLKVFPIIDPCDESAAVDSFLDHVTSMHWPSNMSSLKLRFPLAFNPYLNLPSSLTSLSVDFHSSSEPILKASDVAALPSGLTCMEISKIDWTDFDVSSWPSALTKLHIYKSSLPIDCFKLLPRRLVTLMCLHPLTDGAQNDPDFASLREAGRTSLQPDLQLWNSLKRDLSKRCPSTSAEVLETYIKSVESGHLYGLPLTLTSLFLLTKSYTSNSMLVLPPKVTFLVLDEIDLAGNFFKMLLPTTLTHLMLAQPITHSTLLPTESHLYNMSSLTRLSLLPSKPHDPLGPILEFLPQGLCELELLSDSDPDSWSLNASDIEKLPQNLKNLRFKGYVDHVISLTWIHLLPRTLETLITPDLVIAGLSIKDLPPTLTCLQSSFSDVLLSHVLEFPRSLSSLTLDFCFSDFQSNLSTHSLNALTSAFRPFWRIWEAGEVGVRAELALASQSELSKPSNDPQLIDPRTTRRITRYL